MHFKSLLLAAPFADLVIELRYITNETWRLLDALPAAAVPINHQALIGDARDGLGQVFSKLRDTGAATAAFNRPAAAPAWLAPACGERVMHVTGVARTCHAPTDLPAQLIGFARARHPWIIRDPLGWLRAARPVALANPES